MSGKARKPFASKDGHRPPDQLDQALRAALAHATENSELPCAVASRLADELQKPPSAIGEAADLLGIRLVKCQMGLFGYTPEKKIVKAAAAVDSGLEDTIRHRLENGALACRAA